MEPIRAVIAEDSPATLHGIRATLELEGEVQVVGEATNGLEAVELTRRTRPDLVVLDQWMPGMTGIEALRRIKATAPNVAVVFLSMDESQAQRALAYGANAYILKDAPNEVLLQAIRRAYSQTVFTADWESLDPRCRKVLAYLVEQGKLNQSQLEGILRLCRDGGMPSQQSLTRVWSPKRPWRKPLAALAESPISA
ncbi:MAG: response regulator transcription factor [Chloroflexi bacterium]|nr:response regulator transcription factor [Chloroflexota bacterium]